jgi:cytochrome c553
MNTISRRSRVAIFAIVGVCALLVAPQVAVLAASSNKGSHQTALHFGTPVRLPTFQSCGGYEPGIALDRFGNIFVTAHKQNHCDAVADDPQAPTRGMQYFNAMNCVGCHGPNGAGIPAQFPRLSGQFAEYIAAQLTAFREGKRTNDQNGVMRGVAAHMNDGQIRAVAEYAAGLRP